MCLWIDDDHLLIEDAVFSIVTGDVIALTAKGVCAGALPRRALSYLTEGSHSARRCS